MMKRPLFRYYGSKFRLAHRIIPYFPPHHRVYTETFGGGAGVLLNKPPAPIEVYNDLDLELVRCFRVLQSPAKSRRLIAALEVTPFARVEFERSLEPSKDDVEAARRLIVRSFMGFGSNGASCSVRGSNTTGFRAFSKRVDSQPAHSWATYPAALSAIIERVKRIIIECLPAVDVLQKFDDADVLHYVDPPYLPETRERGHPYLRKYQRYRHELSVADHGHLLTCLNDLRGMIVLSGYPASLYEKELRHWQRVELPAHADGARPRTEVIWINPAASLALRRAA